MLFEWLEPAIIAVEGAKLGAETFEARYYEKYKETIQRNAVELGWPYPEQLATAYGRYQILGENLARYHGLTPMDLDLFLKSADWQRQVAKAQFYRMLRTLIQRRGLSWPHYIYSMWNAGINYNSAYTLAIKGALRKG